MKNLFNIITIISGLLFLITPHLLKAQVDKNKISNNNLINYKLDSVKTLYNTKKNQNKDIKSIDSIIINNNLKIQQTKNFYDSLEIWSRKHKWTREIYNLLITNTYSRNGNFSAEISKSENQYIKYTGAVIRNIKIFKTKVFNGAVGDTSENHVNIVEKIGNNLHINTLNYIIRNNLFFKKGDRIDPFILSDNERILRQLSFIHDAKIKIEPVNKFSDTVDILVYTKDVWSIGIDGSTGSLNDYQLNIYDGNFLGFGRKFSNSIYYYEKERPQFGYEGKYFSENIFGSFISGEMNYHSTFDKNFCSVVINKKFLTPETKYAGLIEISRTSELAKQQSTDTLFSRLAFVKQDFWIGRSFKLSESKRNNLVISARYSEIKMDKKSIITDEFSNKSSLYGSIGFSAQKYYKGSFIYSYGKTEDIPYGYLLEMTGGVERKNSNERLYTSILVSKGILSSLFGYMYGSIKLSTFFKQSFLNDSRIDYEGQYFSPILQVNDYHFRQFVKVDYTLFYNQNSDELLNITKKIEIRESASKILFGANYLRLRLETICFTPWNIIGFKFAPYGYIDSGLMGFTDNQINNGLFSEIGLGVRIRNENLIFKTLEFRLSYYYKIPEKNSSLNFEFFPSGKPRFNDFDVKPQEFSLPNSVK